MSMPSTCHILATNEAEAALFAAGAEQRGATVTGATVWSGIVPPNSYRDIAEGVRMATAEYYYFRVANTRPHDEAVAIANELTGYYVSHLTSPDLPEWYWESRLEPATTIAELVHYLAPVVHTPEGQKAMELLNDVTAGTYMP